MSNSSVEHLNFPSAQPKIVSSGWKGETSKTEVLQMPSAIEAYLKISKTQENIASIFYEIFSTFENKIFENLVIFFLQIFEFILGRQ